MEFDEIVVLVVPISVLILPIYQSVASVGLFLFVFLLFLESFLLLLLSLFFFLLLSPRDFSLLGRLRRLHHNCLVDVADKGTEKGTHDLENLDHIIESDGVAVSVVV